MEHFSKVYSAELEGIEAKLIEVETDINVGLHSFTIVGLADKALNEAKERVNAALKNSHIKPPNRENRRITINLAPADIKKAGSQYDLAIAVGYLLATKQIKEFETGDKMFVGELSLDGKLRSVNGVLAIARLAKGLGIRYVFVPSGNAREAAIVKNVTVIPVVDMVGLIDHLEGRKPIEAQEPTELLWNTGGYSTDISEIKGQANAKRALMIAAAGGHNLLMSGSPGAGKTMLAQALVSILPPLAMNEAIEVMQVYSAAGIANGDVFSMTRPFRAPHHSASPVSVIGGGANPRPGEISLAHRGILFLDELPEFRRDLLESLRQPLENGDVCIARAKSVLKFPARFTLVAAMNPCPCGYYGDDEKACHCGAHEVTRYQRKLSGPLLDRIDIQIKVPRVKVADLAKEKASDESDAVREQVLCARLIQSRRFADITPKIYTNAEMPSKLVDTVVQLDDNGKKFVKQMLEKSFISARGYYRMLKTARTIADLESAETVTNEHLSEAFQYRIREI
ncbi:magnesium chelatase [Candidatus Wolfebacteria bacterium RIFOXYD12_FULL_48_21]|uniref:Magnesium chelatase n=1 Tax=Candidatus Wolfebacteria bacterium RIFOXYD1_FULL_48_65 TaxID=1802561 RepID=A0A1F8E048_9BACT|nr:MAG: magnesium chelatase [Candidatus Wolfebacteria bacterium RIFOXYD1_FULL_48_65]OGM95393.1 MAG: magnesium chelatase [Candidatus Wolfebacteria bacterium RIFOXYD12_FULL_48_21]